MSRIHCEYNWWIGDDLENQAGMWQIFVCEGCMNQAMYKVNLKNDLLPSALTTFPN